MLQQTQVKTVLPYYDRWLQQFPDVQTLAAADEQVVMKAWEGLGYYSRARNLHKAAKLILEDFNGVFPPRIDDAMKLPGIGQTTAGGILSAAFNLPVPIMDGNVKRVLARLIALERPPVQALKQLWEISGALVAGDRGRDFNQALMDLGATVCTPKQPRCVVCPWQNSCAANALGKQSVIPIAAPKAKLPHKLMAVAVIVNQQNEVLIYQRPDRGLLGGLWDFPTVELSNDVIDRDLKTANCERPTANLKTHVQQVFQVAIGAIQPLIQVNHAYTHFKATFVVYVARSVGLTQPRQGIWVSREALGRYPFPKSHLKMFEALAQWHG
jgi:A/G-specific adenine glycosylase